MDSELEGKQIIHFNTKSIFRLRRNNLSNTTYYNEPRKIILIF